MFSILVCLLLATTASCSSWEELWKSNPNMKNEIHAFREFMAEHKRTYVGEEMKNRFELFSQNLKDIERWNKEAAGQTVYGVTQFSDQSLEERKQKYMSGPPDLSGLPKRTFEKNRVTTAQNFDWRDYGMVSPVKDQGQCGSCWAFGTVALAESMNAIAGYYIRDLAEQELVDCFNTGCHGGSPKDALLFIRDHGIASEQAYPYTASEGTCKNATVNPYAWLSNVFWVDSNEQAMQTYVHDHGPVSVSITVADSFDYYKSGIITSNDCNGHGTHEVMINGYGTSSSGVDYWWIKNSWTTGWGQSGFAQVARNAAWCEINLWVLGANQV